MSDNKHLLEKLKFTASKSLTRLVLQALDDARLQIEAQALRFVGAQTPALADEAPKLAERFMQNMHNYFDELNSLTVKDKEISDDDYDNLSLVDQDYLEAIIAMEGMVTHMRNREIVGFQNLIARLEHMFPNLHINEVNNPLDPEQVGDSFNEAIRPLGLKAHYLLTIYREFNKSVFSNYTDIIEEANRILVEANVLPNLEISKRAEIKKSKRKDIWRRVDPDNEPPVAEAQPPLQPASSTPQEGSQEKPKPTAKPKLFGLMQSLIKNIGESSSTGAPLIRLEQSPAAAANEPMDLEEQQAKLIDLLSDLQQSILTRLEDPDEAASIDAGSIGQSIAQKLQAESEQLGSIGHDAADVLNLVTMLYEAIWKDEALSVQIKELIGRTQITMMKVALGDANFFDNEAHPGRVLVNDLALAGIAWVSNEDPDSEVVYAKIKDLVERLLNEIKPNHPFLQGLVDELGDFTAEKTGSDAALERKIRSAEDIRPHIEEVHAYVRQKVTERVLKGHLDPSIRRLLDTHIHDFLVKLLMREGPDGPSWKPIMSTIDVLLWTVQVEKQPGDRERFDRINPRLLDNLQKTLHIGGASKTKITKSMRQLKQVQEYTFHKAESAPPITMVTSLNDETIPVRSLREAAPLPKQDPAMRQTDKLPVGTWLEFTSANGKPIRCELVSRIESIDKLFFANNRGKKVGELTRTRLAHEFKSGTAKIVSKGSLINRAMDSVLDELRATAEQVADQKKAQFAGGSLATMKVDYLN